MVLEQQVETHADFFPSMPGSIPGLYKGYTKVMFCYAYVPFQINNKKNVVFTSHFAPSCSG